MKCKRCHGVIPDHSLYCNLCGFYQLPKPKGEITVPNPIQLPSGKWRIQLRKEGISVIADTPDKCKAKAKLEREYWQKRKENGDFDPKPEIMTLGKVVDKYIESKSAVLAKSTISGYKSTRNNYFKQHWEDDVTQLDPQKIINDEIKTKRKPKTISNAWGVCSAALKASGVSFTTPTLPRKIKKDKAWLDYNQIQIFLKAVKGHDCELVALLALHSLRRSEIYGLKPSNYDQKKQIIHVRGGVTYVTGEGFVYSELNKNDTSRRDVPIIIPRLAELLNAIDKNREYIVDARTEAYYRMINKVCQFADLPEVGLHGLRHSFASLAYHLEWKKLSTQQIGGWKNSKVLDEIYTHNADLESDLKTMQEFYRE